eukprot:gene2191-2055_t
MTDETESKETLVEETGFLLSEFDETYLNNLKKICYEISFENIQTHLNKFFTSKEKKNVENTIRKECEPLKEDVLKKITNFFQDMMEDQQCNELLLTKKIKRKTSKETEKIEDEVNKLIKKGIKNTNKLIEERIESFIFQKIQNIIDKQFFEKQFEEIKSVASGTKPSQLKKTLRNNINGKLSKLIKNEIEILKSTIQEETELISSNQIERSMNEISNELETLINMSNEHLGEYVDGAKVNALISNNKSTAYDYLPPNHFQLLSIILPIFSGNLLEFFQLLATTTNFGILFGITFFQLLLSFFIFLYSSFGFIFFDIIQQRSAIYFRNLKKPKIHPDNDDCKSMFCYCFCNISKSASLAILLLIVIFLQIIDTVKYSYANVTNNSNFNSTIPK